MDLLQAQPMRCLLFGIAATRVPFSSGNNSQTDFPFIVWGVQSQSLISIGCYLIHCCKISLPIKFNDSIVNAIEYGH